MSLILDALKKIEQERARRQVRSLELGTEIVKDRQRIAGFRWRSFAVILGAVVATAATTAAVMIIISGEKGHTSDTVLNQPRAAVSPSPQDTSAVVLTPPAPAPPRTVPPAVTQAKALAPLAYPAPPSAEAERSGTAPDLTVTGIAWQEDRSARRAVVNGVLVSEGSVIAGARVKEILPETVRFSFGTQTIEAANSSPFH